MSYRIPGLSINHYAEPAEVECGTCLCFIDTYSETPLEMADGSYRCLEHREACHGCGDWIITSPKEMACMRCPATGRLEPWCMPCAEDEGLERFEENFAEVAA